MRTALENTPDSPQRASPTLYHGIDNVVTQSRKFTLIRPLPGSVHGVDPASNSLQAWPERRQLSARCEARCGR
jgi:hypothetical protein